MRAKNMIETILLAMVFAKIKGYKLKPVFRYWGFYPIFLFVIIYAIINVSIFVGNYSLIKYTGILEKLYIFTFLILIFKFKLYESAVIGSVCIFFGTFLNKIAIAANGGSMPVFPTLSYVTGFVKPEKLLEVRDIHIWGNEEVKLKFLTDIIDLGYVILSIGDIFIRIFTFIIIFYAIKYINMDKPQVCTNI